MISAALIRQPPPKCTYIFLFSLFQEFQNIYILFFFNQCQRFSRFQLHSQFFFLFVCRVYAYLFKIVHLDVAFYNFKLFFAASYYLIQVIPLNPRFPVHMDPQFMFQFPGSFSFAYITNIIVVF